MRLTMSDIQELKEKWETYTEEYLKLELATARNLLSEEFYNN